MTFLPKKTTTVNGATIAYHANQNNTNDTPGVIFLGGFGSDMTGTKATFLEEHCQHNQQNYLRFDYSGCGASSGHFEDGTIGKWATEACFVLDELTENPQILIGSSMGGWIALLVALARPHRIAGLIGIAAAPDFTEYLIWDRLTPGQKKTLKTTGKIGQTLDTENDPYPITHALITEGRNHLLLKKTLPLPCPTRLLHGTADDDVPWETSLRLLQKITHKDTRLTLLKNGDHRLSSPEHLKCLATTLNDLTKTVAEPAPNH